MTLFVRDCTVIDGNKVKLGNHEYYLCSVHSGENQPAHAIGTDEDLPTNEAFVITTSKFNSLPKGEKNITLKLTGGRNQVVLVRFPATGLGLKEKIEQVVFSSVVAINQNGKLLAHEAFAEEKPVNVQLETNTEHINEALGYSLELSLRQELRRREGAFAEQFTIQSVQQIVALLVKRHE
eukprot:gb/GECH01009485.1/.p1 GENE.gb/GECH01009485.1/~~gb/GECH01009485.1/.p1  ORF type:complete len:180 (+),score=16.86 gb/GECH01009485.1/:1-540(+)